MANRRRQQRQSALPPEENILDFLARTDPSRPQPQPGSEEGTKKGPTIEELQAQIGSLSKRLEEQDRANLALTAAAPVVRETPKQPVFNVEGLPDPIVQPKEYAIELTRRQNAYADEMRDYQTAVSAPVQSVAGNDDALWKEFVSQHGAYAADEDGLEFVLNKVMKRAVAKGIDLEKYRFQHSERFFKDVVETYDNIFGAPETDDEPTPESKPAPRRKAQQAEEEDAGRTGGIMGGSDTGGGTRAKMPEVNPYERTGMLKDLHDLQLKSGYF